MLIEFIIMFLVGFVCGAVVFRRTAILITALAFGGIALYYYLKTMS